MSMFTAFNVSASGMTAQQLRTDVISENIANADTTRTSDGTPYVRKAVVFTEKTMTGTALGKSAYGSYGTGAYSTFSDALRLANGGVVGNGVKVTSVYEDTSTDMEIPVAELGRWKEMFPDASEKELKEKYTRATKALG